MTDNYQRERYKKTMKEMGKLESKQTAGEVFEKHYQGVYEKNKRGIENREASDMVFDVGLNRYKTESNREITRDLNKRVKYYDKLDEGCEDQLEKDAKLARLRNNEIETVKRNREIDIQEKKDKEKEAKRLELQKEELTEQQRAADMLAESNLRVATRQRKTAKSKSDARKIGAIYKRKQDRDYASTMKRHLTVEERTQEERKKQNKRKAIDRGILSDREFNIKYP